MLSLGFLKRYILFSVVVILIVLVGLISCSPHTPKTPNEPYYNGKNAKIEILKKLQWWGTNKKNKTHSDLALLNKYAELDNCMSDKGKITAQPIEKKINFGAFIYPIIRNKIWTEYFKEKGGQEIKHSVLLSVIPYIEYNNNKYILQPLINQNNSNFDNYIRKCNTFKNVIPIDIKLIPHYYSTITLTPEKNRKTNREKLFKLLNKKTSFTREITSQPQQPIQTKTNYNLKDIFQAVFHNKKEITFLKGVSFSVNIFVNGLDKKGSKRVISGSTKKVENKPRPQNEVASSKPIVERVVKVEKPLKKVQATPYHKPKLKGNKNYGVYKFSNIEYCRESTNGNGGNRFSDFTQNGQKINSLKSSYFFKVFDELNGGAVSRCTKSSGGKLTFKPYKCNGKRKLIVVALGNKLNRYNTQIKQAIANIFQANMTTNRKALTLVTIKTGRIVSDPLLQCEDLNDMNSSEAKQIIYKKIKLRFGAYDLRTLEDLELVNYTYQNQLDQLDSIFYLTDGANMPTNITKIDQLAVIPKNTWKAYKGIKLTVLTMGDCTVWKDKAMANCQKIKASTIETALQQFIQGGN